MSPSPSPEDQVKGLQGLVSQLQQKIQQMAMRSAEDRLVISLLQQQCVNALTERKELARQLLTARGESSEPEMRPESAQSMKSDENIDTDEAKPEEDNSDVTSPARPALPNVPVRIIEPSPISLSITPTRSIDPLSSDDEEELENDVDQLKMRIRKLNNTICKLRTEQTAVRSDFVYMLEGFEAWGSIPVGVSCCRPEGIRQSNDWRKVNAIVQNNLIQSLYVCVNLLGECCLTEREKMECFCCCCWGILLLCWSRLWFTCWSILSSLSISFLTSTMPSERSWMKH